MGEKPYPLLLDDITPPHEPIGLLRDALKRVEKDGAVACVVVLVHDDLGVWSESCGHRMCEVLWGLETAKLRLLRHVIDEIIESPLDAS